MEDIVFLETRPNLFPFVFFYRKWDISGRTLIDGKKEYLSMSQKQKLAFWLHVIKQFK